MAIWPFNRKQEQSSDIPQEVQDYYQAEKRERVGVAGLLALGTLLATIVIAIGLFFAGRWVYRAVFDNNGQEAAQVDQEDQQDGDEQSADEPAEGENDGQDGGDQPAGESQGEENEPNEPNEPAELPGEPETTPESEEPEQPAENEDEEDLPRTGPADTLAIFLGTVVVAAAAHYTIGNRKLAK